MPTTTKTTSTIQIVGNYGGTGHISSNGGQGEDVSYQYTGTDVTLHTIQVEGGDGGGVDNGGDANAQYQPGGSGGNAGNAVLNIALAGTQYGVLDFVAAGGFGGSVFQSYIQNGNGGNAGDGLVSFQNNQIAFYSRTELDIRASGGRKGNTDKSARVYPNSGVDGNGGDGEIDFLGNTITISSQFTLTLAAAGTPGAQPGKAIIKFANNRIKGGAFSDTLILDVRGYQGNNSYGHDYAASDWAYFNAPAASTIETSNNIFDGGGGYDTLILSGNQSDYSVTATANGYVVTDLRLGGGVNLTLVNVEEIDFGFTKLVLPVLSTLFTASAEVVNFNSLTSSQQQAIAAGANIYNALGGNDVITLPNTSNYNVSLGSGATLGWANNINHPFVTGSQAGDTDTVNGGDGNYYIVAGAGNDTITITGNGTNTIVAGTGKDIISLSGAQNDTILGITSNDTIDIKNIVPAGLITGISFVNATLSLTGAGTGPSTLTLTGSKGETYSLQVQGQTSVNGGSLIGERFVLSSDGAGGTDLTLQDDTDLAKLAAYTYGDSAIAPGYSPIAELDGNNSLLGLSNDNIGFYAETFEDQATNQIVVAIRGTNIAPGFSTIKNLLADTSWVTGTPEANLLTEVVNAYDYLTSVVNWVRNNDFGASITLTGHSLGGAVAQLLGEAWGLPAIVFNAPSAQQFYNTLSSLIHPPPQVWLVKSGAESTNYRLSRDQVSLAGTPVGNTVTISPIDASFSIGSLLTYHSIKTIKSQLANYFAGNSSSISLTPGPPTDSNYASLAINAVRAVAALTLVTPQGRSFAKFLYAVDTLSGVTTALNIDPDSGSHFVFNEAVGSPAITSLALPAVPGLDHYSVSYYLNGAWSNSATLLPGTFFSLPAGVTEIQFTAFDASNHPYLLSDGFLFQGTFANPGTVSATLTEISSTGLTSDFNGDSASDILFQNVNGAAAIWMLNGTSLVSNTTLGVNPGTAWAARGVGDFDGDGHADILWQNTNGAAAIWLMNGTTLLSNTTLSINPDASWSVAGVGDFNGDGYADILWRSSNGQVAVWEMNGATILPASVTLSINPGTSWSIAGVGDFDGDGNSDILWQNANGQLAIWAMNGTAMLSNSTFSVNPGLSWHAEGVGDFNGDGDADILWQNNSGQIAIWLMNGSAVLSNTTLGINPGPTWHVDGVGDFNGDGDADIQFQNTNGQIAVWLMNGTTLVSNTTLSANAGTSWRAIGADASIRVTTGDFNGDSKSDLLWRNSSTGSVAIWQMNGSSLTSNTTLSLNPGTVWRTAAAGDFNGDGDADIVWQNSATGAVAIWQMSGTTMSSNTTLSINPGISWHIKGAGDLNNDGDADLVWQNTAGQIAVWLMSGTTITSNTTLAINPGSQWQAKGVGDFDGDSKADILFQKANGQVAIWLMNGTTLVSNTTLGIAPGTGWHVEGVGDFDGDGKADILWQNDNGQAAIWLMNGTSITSNTSLSLSPGPSWHITGTADYDGDGKADIQWQNANGQVAVWLMNGTTITSNTTLGINPGTLWRMSGSDGPIRALHADFNADLKSDILWQNTSTGAAAIWQMNGATMVSNSTLAINPGTQWQAMGSSDFNADGSADIIWQNNSTGAVAIWQMSGSTLLSNTTLSINPGTVWQIKALGDVNADGYTDIVWQNSSTGDAAVWQMNGTTIMSNTTLGISPGTAWQVKGAGDFNGDNEADLLWQNSSTGAVAVWLMDGTNILSNTTLSLNPGTAWKIGGVGDFNGDGLADIVWQNTSTGQSAIWLMNGTTISSNTALSINPGTSWSIAGVGDYNGDTMADVIWRNTGGQAAIWQMAGTTIASNTTLALNPGTSWHAVVA